MSAPAGSNPHADAQIATGTHAYRFGHNRRRLCDQRLLRPAAGPQGAKASVTTSEAAKAKLELAVPKPRQRFVAVEAKAKPAAAATTAVPTTPLRAKTSVAKAPVKKSPPPPPTAKDANVQQAAAWWSLGDLFKN